eukprot:6194650-Pleurochrysis_carterae.AAC.8
MQLLLGDRAHDPSLVALHGLEQRVVAHRPELHHVVVRRREQKTAVVRLEPDLREREKEKRVKGARRRGRITRVRNSLSTIHHHLQLLLLRILLYHPCSSAWNYVTHCKSHRQRARSTRSGEGGGEGSDGGVARASALAQVPQPDRVVVRARCERHAVGRKVEREDLLDVALQNLPKGKEQGVEWRVRARLGVE